MATGSRKSSAARSKLTRCLRRFSFALRGVPRKSGSQLYPLSAPTIAGSPRAPRGDRLRSASFALAILPYALGTLPEGGGHRDQPPLLPHHANFGSFSPPDARHGEHLLLSRLSTSLPILSAPVFTRTRHAPVSSVTVEIRNFSLTHLDSRSRLAAQLYSPARGCIADLPEFVSADSVSILAVLYDFRRTYLGALCVLPKVAPGAEAREPSIDQAIFAKCRRSSSPRAPCS